MRTSRRKAALDERSKGFQPIVAAAKAGDAVNAARSFFDLVSNQGPGAFDEQPEAFREMVLENARTVPLLLSAMASAAPTAVSCTRLGGIRAPTLVVGGEHSLWYFWLTNEVVARCIPNSRLAVIPAARHLMSMQNPTAFNEALLRLLAQS